MLPSTGVVHGMLMGSAEDSSRLSIRSEAERFLAMHGFSAPPLPSDQALAARKLTVSQFSLDDLLLKANLPPEDHMKIQAMLNADARTVAFKRDLPAKKKEWGFASRGRSRVHPVAEGSLVLLSPSHASNACTRPI